MGHTVAPEYFYVEDSPLHQKVGVLDYFSLTMIKYSDTRNLGEKRICSGSKFRDKVRQKVVMLCLPPRNREQ